MSQQHNNETAVIPRAKRDRIICLLLSGEFPTDADIARDVGVSPSVITKMLKDDPELAQKRIEAEREIAQHIEKSAIELATTGRNEVAKQKQQEFLLRKLMPEKYGDNVEQTKGGLGPKRVVINLKLPECKTDANGIPILQSANPLQEVLDVKPD